MRHATVEKSLIIFGTSKYVHQKDYKTTFHVRTFGPPQIFSKTKNSTVKRQVFGTPCAAAPCFHARTPLEADYFAHEKGAKVTDA
jgi:spore maturation protein CgeB